MEMLLHYIWKHRIYPLRDMFTTDGDLVEIIDPGLHNTNAGPDFFNAKIKIGGMLWVGNVEIHDRASDWIMHGHDQDEAYDNIILHVVGINDMTVKNSKGKTIRQMQMDVPDNIRKNYSKLLIDDRYPPCHSIIPQLSRLSLHSWMSYLQTERLEQKTEAILCKVKQRNGSWEDAYFMTLARNFGFGVNSDAFEEWANILSLNSVAHHRDDIFQIEAIFLGQAGLLDINTVPGKHHDEAETDNYYVKLKNEYNYLSRKFNLKTIDPLKWKFLRLRPQNFPNIRISQLANLYYNRRANFSSIVECKTVDELREIFSTHVTPYWETHYSFGSSSKKSEKHLSRQSKDVIVLNTVVPILFAYGKYKNEEDMCDRAFRLLEELKAEENSITRMWQDCGLELESAADSQAIIQLKKEYCDRKECLRCRIGYEYIKSNGWFVKDND